MAHKLWMFFREKIRSNKMGVTWYILDGFKRKDRITLTGGKLKTGNMVKINFIKMP